MQSVCLHAFLRRGWNPASHPITADTLEPTGQSIGSSNSWAYCRH
jgi:hypothetical protein